MRDRRLHVVQTPAGVVPNELALTPASESQETQSGSKGMPKARVHSTRILPSDRHSFAHHFEILKRFVLRSRNGQEGVPADKVEGEGIPAQAASMNVRFMRDLGLLNVTERAQYVPTPEAIKFVMARSVDDNRARPILRDVVARSWFAELAQEHFRLDPVMTEDRFVGELALACETDKAKKGASLKILVEYLVYSGLLVRDERGLSLGTSGMPTPAVETPPPGPTPPAPSPRVDATRAPEQALGAVMPPSADGDGWRVLHTNHFQVRVREDMDSLEELSDFLDTLKKSVKRKLDKQAAGAAGGTSST